MKIIDLKQFIRTGDFGGIKVGTSTKQDVIDLMGSGFDWGDFGETQIIKYGWYEFFYWTNTEVVFAIQNDHLQNDCTNHDEMIEYENDAVRIDTWFLKVDQDITFSQVANYLKGEGLAYQLEAQDYDGAIEYMRLPSGIAIDFTDEKKVWKSVGSGEEWDMQQEPINIQEDYILNGIRLFQL